MKKKLDLDQFYHEGCTVLCTTLESPEDGEPAEEIKLDDNYESYLQSYIIDAEKLIKERWDTYKGGIFSNEAITKLLDLVYEHCNKIIGNDGVRRYAWNIIKRGLSDVAPHTTSGKICKKWHYLRRKFVKYQTKSTEGSIYIKKPKYYQQMLRISERMEEIQKDMEIKNGDYVPNKNLIWDHFGNLNAGYRGGTKKSLFTDEETSVLLRIIHANADRLKKYDACARISIWEPIHKKMIGLVPKPYKKEQLKNRWVNLLRRYRKHVKHSQNNTKRYSIYIPQFAEEIGKILRQDPFEDPQDGFEYRINSKELKRSYAFSAMQQSKKVGGFKEPIFSRKASLKLLMIINRYYDKLKDDQIRKQNVWEFIAEQMNSECPGISAKQVNRKWIQLRLATLKYLQGVKKRKPDFFNETVVVLRNHSEEQSIRQLLYSDIAPPSASGSRIAESSDDDKHEELNSIHKAKRELAEEYYSAIFSDFLKFRNDESAKIPTERNYFTKTATLVLLQLIHAYRDVILNPDVSKIDTWRSITKIMKDYMPGIKTQQVISKWHSLKLHYRRYKKSQKGKPPPFYLEIEALFDEPTPENLGDEQEEEEQCLQVDCIAEIKEENIDDWNDELSIPSEFTVIDFDPDAGSFSIASEDNASQVTDALNVDAEDKTIPLLNLESFETPNETIEKVQKTKKNSILLNEIKRKNDLLEKYVNVLQDYVQYRKQSK